MCVMSKPMVAGRNREDWRCNGNGDPPEFDSRSSTVAPNSGRSHDVEAGLLLADLIQAFFQAGCNLGVLADQIGRFRWVSGNII